MMTDRATTPELMRTLEVCFDQVRMWRETIDEDIARFHQMVLSGIKNNSVQELEKAMAAFEETKARSATIIPTKPDKSRS